MFGRFVLVFTAFCLYVAVPLVRFSTFFPLFLAVLSIVAVFFWGGLFFFLGGLGGCNNVLSLAFYLTALFGAML